MVRPNGTTCIHLVLICLAPCPELSLAWLDFSKMFVASQAALGREIAGRNGLGAGLEESLGLVVDAPRVGRP